MTPRRLCCWLAVAQMGIAGLNMAWADEPIGPDFETLTATGDIAVLRLTKSMSSDRLRLTNGEPLASYKRLARRPELQDPVPREPLSSLILANGDRLTASIRQADDRGFEVCLPSGLEVRVPLGAISEVQLNPGMESLATTTDWIDADGRPIETNRDGRLLLKQRATLRWPASPHLMSNSSRQQLKREESSVLSRGQAVVWLKVPATVQDVVSLSFDFGVRSPSLELKLHRDESGRGGIETIEVLRTTNSTRKAVRRLVRSSDASRESELCVRALLTNARFAIAVNQDVVAAGQLADGLHGLELRRTANDTSYEFGPSWVQKVIPQRPALMPGDRRLDALQREFDDVLFGRLKSVTADKVLLTVRQTDFTFPRREVLSFRSGEQHQASLQDWIAGTHCRIVLQGQQLIPERVSFDTLHGVITSLHEESFDITHATGTRLRFDWGTLQQVEPLFVGKSCLIGVGTRHLGNTARDDFSRPQPDGLTWRLAVPEFLPAGDIILSVTVADLIPAGSQTLRGTPFLKDVRSGFLATKVFVNGRDVGSLNERTSVANRVGDPVRVQMPLARHYFRRDANVIEIRQTAARDDSTQFDDCELQNVTLEVR